MAAPNVLEFTDLNFDDEVIQSPRPVVVDFWAEWCQPCRLLAPTIDEIAKHYGDKAKVGKLDTDANREVATRYGISAIPTVIIFKDGEPAKKFVGLTPKDQFTEAIDAMFA